MKKNELLLIGKVPPPLGGVTIHVSRLLDVLEENNMQHSFIPLSLKNIYAIFLAIPKTNLFHLHSSHAFVQFVFVMWAYVWSTNSIITIHRDIKRYKGISWFLVNFAVKYCYCPIVLNDSSFNHVKALNRNCKKISSFIPPLKAEHLDKQLITDIMSLRNTYSRVFSTNASALTYDSSGVEIYGVLDLIKVCSGIKDLALVVCDPSGQYEKYFSTRAIELPNNVYLISHPHSYFEILKYVEGSIRNTSTDGDAISVKESLYLRVPTYVTDVVSRPEGVIVFKRGDYTFLSNTGYENLDKATELDGSKDLLKLYFDLLMNVKT